jgi:hypothetical protein
MFGTALPAIGMGIAGSGLTAGVATIDTAELMFDDFACWLLFERSCVVFSAVVFALAVAPIV